MCTAFVVMRSRCFPNVNCLAYTDFGVAIAIQTVPTSASESPFSGQAFHVVANA